MQITKVSLMSFQGKGQIGKKAAEAAKKLETNFNEYAYAVPTGTREKSIISAEEAARLTDEQVRFFIEKGNKTAEKVKEAAIKDTTHDYLSASMQIEK